MRLWTEEEHALAAGIWESGGTKADIAKALGRSHSSVRSYIDKHRDEFKERHKVRSEDKWTDEEMSALMRHYPLKGASWEGWQLYLNGRTKAAIRAKAEYMGIERRRGEDWDSRQRAALLRGLLTLSGECRHTPRECVAEMVRLVRGAI